jgi:hypothetical protein
VADIIASSAGSSRFDQRSDAAFDNESCEVGAGAAVRVEARRSLQKIEDQALLDVLSFVPLESVPSCELPRFPSNESEGVEVERVLKIVVHVLLPHGLGK